MISPTARNYLNLTIATKSEDGGFKQFQFRNKNRKETSYQELLQ